MNSEADDSGFGFGDISSLSGVESIYMESDIDNDECADEDYIPTMYSSSESDPDVAVKECIEKAIHFSIDKDGNKMDENDREREVEHTEVETEGSDEESTQNHLNDPKQIK